MKKYKTQTVSFEWKKLVFPLHQNMMYWYILLTEDVLKEEQECFDWQSTTHEKHMDCNPVNTSYLIQG